MNINDFVILPGSKTGVSVKLKEKSVRELQLEKVQLELENKEMEKKLKQLQSNMSREKQERERANGYRWKSGQAGLGTQPPMLQNKENVVKVPSGKVKLRLLKEHVQAPDPAKQPFVHKTANDAATEKPKMKVKTCGQCEMKPALLVCLECGEDYCPSCFARIHQKGALKLHRTTSLTAKTHIPIGKLEAAQQFLKTISPTETNHQKNNGQKTVTSAVEDIVAVPSSLPKMPTDNIELIQKHYTVPSTEGSAEIQNGGFFLHGTFDEEESAKSFQEALNQWRSRNCSQTTKEEHSCQVGSENSGTCQVQTSPPIMKKPVEIEFREDGLKYMERLLIKKHRRNPVDKLPYNIIMDELKLKESLTNEIPDTWSREEEEEEVEEEEEDDIEITHNTAIELKKYWADVLRQEEPETVLINSEPSLKIKFLEDACKEESEEEPTNFIVMEAGSDELIYYGGTISKSQKIEPDIFLPPTVNITTRSPLSSVADREKGLTFLHNKHKETPKARTPSQSEKAAVAGGSSCAEEMAPSSLFERAITKDKCGKTKKKSCCMSNEQTSGPPKWAASKPFPVMELVKESKVSQDMHDASPVTPKDSLLLQVARREKPACNPYRGLEGFFTMGTNCLELRMDSIPSSHKARESPKSSISFSGSEQWTRHFSLGEYADESLVHEILEKEPGRSLSRLGRQTPSIKLSLPILSIDNASSRPFSANIPLCRIVKHSPRSSSVIETASKHLNTRPLSQAAFEISEIEGIDVTENDDPFLEYYTNQQALTDLDHELRSITDSWENLNGLNYGDFNRHSKITYQDFHNNHEIKDSSQGDAVRIYDEHYTDDEEDQMDKQQVIELQ